VSVTEARYALVRYDVRRLTGRAADRLFHFCYSGCRQTCLEEPCR